MKKQNNNLKRITNFLEAMDWAFELNNFKRTLLNKELQPEDCPDLTAEVVPDMTYKELTIRLYPNFWTLPLQDQRKALLHELVHTLIQDTKMIANDLLNAKFRSLEEIKNANEKATSSITHLLDNLLIGNLKYAKKAYKDYMEIKKKKKLTKQKRV